MVARSSTSSVPLDWPISIALPPAAKTATAVMAALPSVLMLLPVLLSDSAAAFVCTKVCLFHAWHDDIAQSDSCYHHVSTGGSAPMTSVGSVVIRPSPVASGATSIDGPLTMLTRHSNG